MAKNFVEEGKTVAIVASAAISSGDLVQVGDVFAVALTDIPQGETGDGMTEGVFMLPKLKTDDMKTGKKVYLKSGKVQLPCLRWVSKHNNRKLDDCTVYRVAGFSGSI